MNQFITIVDKNGEALHEKLFWPIFNDHSTPLNLQIQQRMEFRYQINGYDRYITFQIIGRQDHFCKNQKKGVRSAEEDPISLYQQVYTKWILTPVAKNGGLCGVHRFIQYLQGLEKERKRTLS